MCSFIPTHHKVAAEVVLSPLLVPLAHGLHLLGKLSQDAGLVHPSAGLERIPVPFFFFFLPPSFKTNHPRVAGVHGAK